MLLLVKNLVAAEVAWAVLVLLVQIQVQVATAVMVHLQI